MSSSSTFYYIQILFSTSIIFIRFIHLFTLLTFLFSVNVLNLLSYSNIIKLFILVQRSRSTMGRKNKFYAVARGHSTGIHSSWEKCQKATKGYKEARFKAFDTKREAQDWLKSECNNSTDEAIESAGTRKTRPRPSKKGEHCKMDCKFDGEDEKKGDMIQCCLCNIWFHVECIMVTKTKGVTDRIIIEDTENNETTTTGPLSTAENLGVAHQATDHSSLESQTTKLLDEQPEDTESQHPKSTGNSEEVENYEDDIVTNSVSASGKSDTEGNVDRNIDDLNDKVWICENCKSLPSEIHKLKQSNMNIEKELKSIKDILEDIHKGSTNENKIEHKPQFQNNQGSSTETTPQPASCQCAHKHNPNHGNKSNIQYMMENKSEIETKRIIVEENIVLKKENRELRDRLTIYERVLDQILRDQEDKRMQISKTEEWFTQKRSGRKPQK